MRCGHATQRVDGAYAGDPPRQLGIHSAKSTPCRTLVVVPRYPSAARTSTLTPRGRAADKAARTRESPPTPTPTQPRLALSVLELHILVRVVDGGDLQSRELRREHREARVQLHLGRVRRLLVARRVAWGKARTSAPWRGRPRRAPEKRCTSQSRHGRSGPTFDRAVVPRPRTVRVAHRERWASAPEMRRPPTARALAPAQARPHRVLSRRRWARDAPPLHVPPPLGARTM